MNRSTRNAGAAVAAATVFTGFVVAKGIPTLRHDWGWPVDARAIPSFFQDAVGGWLPLGFGIAATHPTTYLVNIPLTMVMLLCGTLAALALFAFALAYCSASAAQTIALRCGSGPMGAAGIAAFAIFNPWVYNEVVAGHLIMVLAYGALLGLFGEMLRGPNASPLRLALWVVLALAQLQFFVVAWIATIVFAAMFGQKWLPVIAGIVVALPAVVGVIAERGALLQTPYLLQWQANQSLYPLPLLTLGGYFAGYADRLGVVAQGAVTIVLALFAYGVASSYRRRSTVCVAAAAIVVFCIALGVHGPFAVAYAAFVRAVPESGIFRELYDLGGVFAALLAIPAAVAAGRSLGLQWAALVAGLALPVTWFAHPPSDLWVGANAYPHPAVAAAPYARVALLPAFQPLQLRDGRGDGADPDIYVYANNGAPVNAYFPSFPVDAALARYVQSGDDNALAALGVQRIVNRPWLLSRSNGEIGLAAASLPSIAMPAVYRSRTISGALPLISTCSAARVVATPSDLRTCDVFFTDAPNSVPLAVARSSSESIDSRTAWIDATLAFARDPSLAQAFGGVMTQSREPFAVTPNGWLLAYVRGALRDGRGRALLRAPGTFGWIWLSATTDRITCEGVCEAVGETRAFPAVRLQRAAAVDSAVAFDALAPWLIHVRGLNGGLLRFNARYDRGWLAFSGTRLLTHVRVSLDANAWFLPTGRSDVVLLQLTALLQYIAELAGLVYTAFLLKALFRRGTKRI